MKLLQTDFFRTLMLALALLGVLAVGYAGYTYFQARDVIARVDSIASDIEGMTPEQQQAVLSSIPPALLIEQRQAIQDQTRSLIIGGVGLVGIGVGWLGYDVSRSRRQAATQVE
jgi:hypothetical protein